MRRMADSVNPADVPPGFDLYAGYDDGAWPDAGSIAARYPGKTVIRVTVNPADDKGDCLDVERGDARPQDAPGWVAERRAAGHRGPLVYCSLDLWGVVRLAFQNAQVPEPGYWVAGYPGGGPVIPAGAVAHQWIDRGPYDESVVVDYLPGIDPAPNLTEDSVLDLGVDGNGNRRILAVGAGGATPARHLLHITFPDATGADLSGAQVADITDGIAAKNGGWELLVQG